MNEKVKNSEYLSIVCKSLSYSLVNYLEKLHIIILSANPMT